MNTEEVKNIIQEISAELLEKIGFSAQVKVSEVTASSDQEIKDNLLVDWEIDSDDSKFIIGRHGANLNALQHILRILVRKKTDQLINLNLDINRYHAQQTERIISLSQESAAQATAEGKTVIMEPMNSFERRLVHLELEDFKGVRTESIGEGDNRKVVIKPESISEELDL